MRSYVKFCSFGSALIFAVVVSLIAPIRAVADDTTPPPVQTEEPSQGDEAPPVQTEEPLQGDEANDSQEAVQEVGDEVNRGVSEIIEQLPEETGIYLVTEEGVEPLATQQAENLILVGDPIWCPVSIAPIPNVGGCSDSYSSLEDFILNFPDDPGVPGVIWIMEGVDTSTSLLSFDGSYYTNWDAEDLVIQGGWNGDSLGTISSQTTFNVPIEVIGWTGNITINNLVITGTSGTGLYIDVDGDVSLNDLEITDNGDTGLYVNTGGIVEAENITVNNNGFALLSGYGAEIQGSEVQLTGVNEFNGNYDTGLIVSALGDITINNLTANNNGSSGYAVGADLYSTSGNVTLLGVNQFLDNRNNGLYIEALNGSITAENITASSNGIGTSYAPGAELLASSLNLTGTNVFIGNNDTGLVADVSGDITITNINASNNGIPGTYGPGAELYSAGIVTITGMNVFSGNSSEGLIIEADGNISVTNVDALNNDGSGLVFVTNADAYAECGLILNNAGVQIDTAMPSGILTLTGVDFGGDPDQNIGIDYSQLNLVSNVCFNYPNYYSDGDNETGGSTGQNGAAPSLTVSYVNIVSGQTVNLDCALHNEIYVLLEDGDGVIIPCPIVGTVKLDDLTEISPYGVMTEKHRFVSGMDLTISGDEQIFKPVAATDIIWYFTGAGGKTGGYQALHWDGNEWVDITDQIPPFLTIFFLVPEEFDRENLAILHWDGANWIELSEGAHLGQGRFVSEIGYNETSKYFQANVNFTGVFILVQK